MVQIDENKLQNLTTLKRGNHPSPQKGLCFLEAVAYVAGEEHSDHPQCVCPVIAAMGRRLNDQLRDDERQKLRDLIPLLVGTRGSLELQRQRAFRSADWAVREIAPLALELQAEMASDILPRRIAQDRAKLLREHASLLRALARVKDRKTALKAKTHAAAYAATYAAYVADDVDAVDAYAYAHAVAHAADAAAYAVAAVAHAYAAYAYATYAYAHAAADAADAAYAAADTAADARAPIIDSAIAFMRGLCEMRD